MIETKRLILRLWRESDGAPFAELNADHEVMEFLPATLTTAQSDAFVATIRAHWDEHGYGLWAVELKDGTPFIGYVGLAKVHFEAHFAPAVEIGWRLSRAAWGAGFASEAARAALAFAFDTLSLDQVVSFTVPANRRSLGVMERIGLRHDGADDFDHPSMPDGHPLQRHVLHRLRRTEWTPC